MFDGSAAIQRVPELMVEWVERNIMKFVEDEYEVLQLGQKPPQATEQAGDCYLRSSFARKDLELVVDIRVP